MAQTKCLPINSGFGSYRNYFFLFVDKSIKVWNKSIFCKSSTADQKFKCVPYVYIL